MERTKILQSIKVKKTIRSDKVLWTKKGLCKCPDCPKHHIWGTLHPIYASCIFCLSPYERSLFPDIWSDYDKYDEIERCDEEVIKKLALENVVVKKAAKVSSSISDIVAKALELSKELDKR